MNYLILMGFNNQEIIKKLKKKVVKQIVYLIKTIHKLNNYHNNNHIKILTIIVNKLKIIYNQMNCNQMV